MKLNDLISQIKIFFEIAILILGRNMAFDLPPVDEAHDFIEFGSMKYPVKAVFSCHKNFTEYPLTKDILVFQDSADECAKVNEKLLCIFELQNNDKAYADDCLMSDIHSLERSYLNADYHGAIGYPTQFWESKSWQTLKQYNYTVAISSEATNLICGENKIVFQQWMVDNGFERFIPKTYKTPQEAKLPCVVKLRPITGTDSNGVIIAKTQAELDDAVAKEIPGEPLLIQEAVVSKAELVICFIAYQGRLLNRVNCRVSYKDDPLTLMGSFVRGSRFRVKCRNIPGYEEEIRPFMKSISEKLTINGMAFLNLKIIGASSEDLFYGNNDIVREWKSTLNIRRDDSFVKIIEIHARVGGGLQSDPKTFSKMIRAYHLAHFSAAYNQNNYEHALYETHRKKQREGEAPEYEAIE